jgi:hypothetical protein
MAAEGEDHDMAMAEQGGAGAGGGSDDSGSGSDSDSSSSSDEEVEVSGTDMDRIMALEAALGANPNQYDAHLEVRLPEAAGVAAVGGGKGRRHGARLQRGAPAPARPARPKPSP